jgi:apolipoprotein N-acyltransferase
MILAARSDQPRFFDYWLVMAVQSRSPSLAEQQRLTEAAMAKGQRPALVVWPEYTLQQTPEENPEAYAEASAWAKRHRVTLVFGGVTNRGDNKFSSAAYVLGRDWPSGEFGKLVGVYEKHDPLPFFQDGEPGGGYPVFGWSVGEKTYTLGVTICFDLSFERNARRLATNGARFLVVPSEEPADWPRLEQQQHALIAPVRAAENGIGILRASAPGPSQMVGTTGRVMASLPLGVEGTLVYPTPKSRMGPSQYARLGWRFPWLCQAVTLLWLLMGATKGRRGTKEMSRIEA